ncbi:MULTISPECIES: hypothetical protein [Sphingomonas]|uniref:hypothetical protein n=1 Tax=Sphingomonas TaxID=13687 RepID=UPI000DEFE932|nr:MULTISPECIES: hypothetical protein [Sphingomonas]
MAKDKKSKKAKEPKGGVRVAVSVDGEGKRKGKKNKGGEHGLEALASKVLDHPLVSDLLAIGAMAAVAAIAESGKADPAKAKSKNAVKAAGKAAAAAIGTRLLKEVTGGAKKA